MVDSPPPMSRSSHPPALDSRHPDAGERVPIGLTVSSDVEGRLQNPGLRTDPGCTAPASANHSEHVYLEVFNSTSEAIFLHDAQGRVIDANQRACAMYGCSREDLIDSSPERFSAGGEGASAEDALAWLELSQREGPQVFRWHCRKLNGERFWTEVSLRATEIAGEARVIATVRDITARLKQEADLYQAEFEAVEWKRRYEQLTRAAGEVVYEISDTGDILYGGAFEATLGYAPDEMQGGFDQWMERLHPEDRERASSAAITAGNAGEKFHAEYRYRHRSGDYLVISDTAYPYATANGKVVRYIGVMVNVTAARRAEAERERLEERLRHAQKMESIGRLAGGIAHDFNNLLTTIGGNLALAGMDEHLSADTRELLEEIDKAAQSAVHLTRQLLMFSRKQIIEPKVLCVNDTVHRIEKLLRRLIGEDVELRVALCEQLGPVRIDENQLEQVMVNLVINARDAMPQGGKLTIETANVELDDDSFRERAGLGEGRYVLLSISDTGSGMTPEIREHIFEPFFTTKEVGKGTGLGLAMVYGAVQQNYGAIEVYSEPGLGTSMHVYLPRSDLPVQVTRESKVGAVRGGAETIVLVEDAEPVRMLAERILSRHGYRVHAYENGAEALEAIRRLDAPIDLLLTDVVMPRMNGRELAERVLAMRPQLRILFASGYSEDAILHHGVLEAGIEFIAKPYSVAELTRRVREILDKPC